MCIMRFGCDVMRVGDDLDPVAILMSPGCSSTFGCRGHNVCVFVVCLRAYEVCAHV